MIIPDIAPNKFKITENLGNKNASVIINNVIKNLGKYLHIKEVFIYFFK